MIQEASVGGEQQCQEAQDTAMDRARQIGGVASRAAVGFLTVSPRLQRFEAQLSRVEPHPARRGERDWQVGFADGF